MPDFRRAVEKTICEYPYATDILKIGGSVNIRINQKEVEMLIIITEYYQLLQSLSLAHIVALRFKR